METGDALIKHLRQMQSNMPFSLLLLISARVPNAVSMSHDQVEVALSMKYYF